MSNDEAWCNHDEPAVNAAGVCECGEMVGPHISTMPWVQIGFEVNAKTDRKLLQREYPGLRIVLLGKTQHKGIRECFLMGPRLVVIRALVERFGWTEDNVDEIIDHGAGDSPVTAPDEPGPCPSCGHEVRLPCHVCGYSEALPDGPSTWTVVVERTERISYELQAANYDEAVQRYLTDGDEQASDTVSERIIEVTGVHPSALTVADHLRQIGSRER